MYYVYMLRCIDNSLYTGITTDVIRRMNEHFSQDKKCAKYTLRHKAMKLESVWQTENRVLASKLEYYIKALSKEKKEKLTKNHKLEEIADSRIDAGKYIYIKGDTLNWKDIKK